MKNPPARLRGFTLIEIMIVVALMGIILATGIPPIYRLTKKEGIRRAVSDVTEVCSNARARAIFSGSPVDVVFHPLERRFEISGGAPTTPDLPETLDGEPIVKTKTPMVPGSGTSGVFPDDVIIEMLDVNLLEYRESEFVRVRFYPNGTCDEMTLILRSNKSDEWRAVTLEVTTGLTSVETDMNALARR